MKASEFKKIVGEKLGRGILLHRNIHPDKETDIDVDQLMIDRIVKNQGMAIYRLYESDIDKYDNNEHPNDWDGHCYQCYVNEDKIVYHKFKGKSVVEAEKRAEAENRDKRIDNIIDELEAQLKKT